MISNIDQEKCTGCGICVELCIMDVIRLGKQNNKAYIAYPEDCQLCYQCELECPQKAVYVDFTPIKRPAVIEYSEGG
jgi:NAD-dependent dihydropyrimidine dehydrogenase PreA subunit